MWGGSGLLAEDDGREHRWLLVHRAASFTAYCVPPAASSESKLSRQAPRARCLRQGPYSHSQTVRICKLKGSSKVPYCESPASSWLSRAEETAWMSSSWCRKPTSRLVGCMFTSTWLPGSRMSCSGPPNWMPLVLTRHLL